MEEVPLLPSPPATSLAPRSPWTSFFFSLRGNRLKDPVGGTHVLPFINLSPTWAYQGSFLRAPLLKQSGVQGWLSYFSLPQSSAWPDRVGGYPAGTPTCIRRESPPVSAWGALPISKLTVHACACLVSDPNEQSPDQPDVETEHTGRCPRRTLGVDENSPSHSRVLVAEVGDWKRT